MEKFPTKLSISRSEIHVWRIDLDFVNYNFEKLSFLLSSEEVRRYSQFFFQHDRYRYQVTHGMKRMILANYLDYDPRLLCFEIESHGKPIITNVQNSLNVQFNISHSHNIILIAVTIEDALGIDVEYHRNKIELESLGEIFFSPVEKKAYLLLKSQQEKINAFFRCWTRKEAYLKAKGIGLITDLSSISVDMHELPAYDWLKVSTFEEVKWKLFPLYVGQFYTSSIVATSYQKKLCCYDANCFRSNI